MGALHVCFADLPQYGSAAPPIDASPTLKSTTKEIGALYELGTAVDGGMANATTMMTQQADLNNKGIPPRIVSPGVNNTNSISPTPRYERNISFFHQLSRRMGLHRSSDDPVFSAAEDDSTDSCSSTTGAMPKMQHSATGASTTTTTSSSLCAPNASDSRRSSSGNNRSTHLHTGHACLKDGDDGSSSEHISCASSETSSTVDIEESQEQERAHSPTATATNKSTTVKERRSNARASFSRLQRRSTSSIRRAFESFSLSTRSLSCSGSTATNSTVMIQRTNSSNTPIKSALKYNSNAELNRKSQAGNANGIGSWNTSYSASNLQLSSASGTTNTSSATSSKPSSKGKTKPPPQRILRQPVSYTYLKGISGLPTQRVPRSAVCCQYARR